MVTHTRSSTPEILARVLSPLVSVMSSSSHKYLYNPTFLQSTLTITGPSEYTPRELRQPVIAVPKQTSYLADLVYIRESVTS